MFWQIVLGGAVGGLLNLIGISGAVIFAVYYVKKQKTKMLNDVLKVGKR